MYFQNEVDDWSTPNAGKIAGKCARNEKPVHCLQKGSVSFSNVAMQN